MTLHVPGKTFLVGEYAVLVGGKALGLATTPVFSELESKTEFHPQSAAALYLKSISKAATGLQLSNPYEAGGFGYSTAEFLSCWFKYADHLSFESAFNTYRNLFNSTKVLNKIKPSGADLATQFLGNITYFDPILKNCESLAWPFPNLSFFIVSTGLKVATHEHLADLKLSLLSDLPVQAEKVIHAFLEKNEGAFISELKKWTTALTDLNLQHNNSLEIKSSLEKDPGIILVKPNGALGVDTLTVFFKSKDKNLVQEKLNQARFKIQASELDITSGACYVD